MIVLYNPPSNEAGKPVLPMALLALGAVIEERREYVIVDGNLEGDPLSALTATIRRQDAEVLAVTVMGGPQLHHAVPHCRALKERYPDLTIIWGGYFPTQHYEICLRADYVDLVVRGHGEQTFARVLKTLERGGDLGEIPGLAYREPGSGVLRTNERAPIPDPNALPGFPYHRVPMERYVRSTFMGERTLPHHSSYGCPFTCNFCAVVNMVDGSWLKDEREPARLPVIEGQVT